MICFFNHRKNPTIFLGELACLLVGDLSLIGQIRLVSNQENHCVVVRQIPGISQPAAQMIISGPLLVSVQNKFSLARAPKERKMEKNKIK